MSQEDFKPASQLQESMAISIYSFVHQSSSLYLGKPITTSVQKPD